MGFAHRRVESYATVELTYHFTDQPLSVTSTTALANGMFFIYLDRNATSLDLTVIDRAGNRSETISQIISDLPTVIIDHFKGDATDNTYVIDTIDDFIQEYIVEPYAIYKDVWIDNSYMYSDWSLKAITNRYGLLMDIMNRNGPQVVIQLYKIFIKIKMV